VLENQNSNALSAACGLCVRPMRCCNEERLATE
jgi:hypothetical protein